MTMTVRIVALLHMLLYMGIMWWGWKSYRVLRKMSWLLMGIGFGVLLIFRADQAYALWTQPVAEMSARQMWETFTPFIGAAFLVASLWLISHENQLLLQKLRRGPVPLPAGEQSVEFWEELVRKVVSEEVTKIKLKSIAE